MKYKPLIWSVALLLSGLGSAHLYAQESVNASGGDASGSGGSVSWSVGQVVYRNPSGANGSITEGVQQPYEIFVVTGIKEAQGISLSASVYPNPATDYLVLSIDKFEISDLSYQLYDLSGRLLRSKDITKSRTNITLENLTPAAYFIKVLQNSRQIKTFKIIKQ